MSTETPLKPTRTYAEQFAKIEITAEQRREAHMRALEILRGCAPAEILHEHPSGTPEWEPVCEPLPLPVSESALLAKWQPFSKPVSSEPFKWTECQRVVMPPAAPQQAEDVVEVYRAPRQPTSLPDMPPPITTLTYGNSW
jgi:hypothetical protein